MKLKKALSVTLAVTLATASIMGSAMALEVGDNLDSDSSFGEYIYDGGSSPWVVGDTTDLGGGTATVSDTDSAHSGTTAFNIWFSNTSSGGSCEVYQTIATIPAGTYTLTGYIMGGEGDAGISVTFSVGDNALDACSTTGWGNWVEATGEITVTETLTNVNLTATFSGVANSWGWIDDVSLVCTSITDTDAAEDTDAGEDSTDNTDTTDSSDSTDSSTTTTDTTSDTTTTTSTATVASQYVVNGGFETDNIWSEETAWTFDDATWTAINLNDDNKGTIKVNTETSHSGSNSLQYWFYQGDAGDAPGGDIIAYQTIASIPAGTYQLSGWTMGGETTGIEITVGDVTVTAQNTGWENWVQTNIGTVTFDKDMTDVVITVKITGKAGDWGYIDDISLVPVDGAPVTGDATNASLVILAIVSFGGFVVLNKKKRA